MVLFCYHASVLVPQPLPTEFKRSRRKKKTTQQLVLQLKLVSVFAHQRWRGQWKAARAVHMTSIYFSLSVTVTFESVQWIHLWCHPKSSSLAEAFLKLKHQNLQRNSVLSVLRREQTFILSLQLYRYNCRVCETCYQAECQQGMGCNVNCCGCLIRRGSWKDHATT